MVTLFVLIAALVLNAAPVDAAPAGTWFSEAELPTKYDQVIFPFYQSMTSGVLNGKGGVLLNYRKFEVPNERGAIVLVSGYKQSHVQFAELMYGLTKLGFSVYIMDNRGMGFSSRLLPDQYKVHTTYFYDYAYDLRQFMDDVVKRTSHRRTIMLAHSMGGATAILYNTMYPGNLDAMILDSPMVEARFGPLNEAEAMLISSNAYGPLGRMYAPGQKDPDRNKLGLGDQTMTHSQARHDVKVKIWNQVYPDTLMGGATNDWVYYTAKASSWMRGHYKLDLPVLMLQADQDTIVVAKREKWLCDRLANCRLVYYPGSYHEILWETDNIRNPALGEIENFLDAQAR